MLKNKNAVVTGATRGIGREIAFTLAENGANVAINYRTLNEDVERLIEELKSYGTNIVAVKCDISDEEEVKNFIAESKKQLGSIDILINNAGITKDGLLMRMKEKDFSDVLDVNLKGTFLCCQVAIDKMLKNGGGTILNMSSLSGKKASSWQTIYCASKFGVQGLTQSIAKEFADKNIRVNSICPGIVHTEMWDRLKYEYAKKRDLDPEEVLPYFKKNIPMHKLVDLQDVIQAAIFLLTDCSSYLTGQSINLVGGEWMD